MGRAGIRAGDNPKGQQRQPDKPKPGAGGTKKLPKLSEALRDLMDERFDDEGDFGTRSGPGEATLRRLMRQGLAQGLEEKDVRNFLNPAFYRAVGDPYGGGKLLKDLTSDQIASLAEWAGKQRGSGLGAHGSATASQTAFFEAFPDLQSKYVALANSYNQAPDLTNGMSTTPPNAVLGSDGKWHDPTQDLPSGVTLPGYTPPTTTGEQAPPGGTNEGVFMPFTQPTGEQTGVPGYPVTPYADFGSAMTAAQGMLANHYASAAAAGDFQSAQSAFGQLQAHQDFMGSQTPATPVSESFSEADLYQESQYR